MGKIVYSFIFTLLSVSCSSDTSQNSFTTPKDVETLSKEQAIDNQVKKDSTFPRQWLENMSWFFINTSFTFIVILLGAYLDNWTFLFKSMKERDPFPRFLTFVILPLTMTCIAALFATYLQFINEEKQVKEQDRQFSFFKRFLANWVPTLLTTAWTALSIFALKNSWSVTTNPRYNKIKHSLFVFICPLGFACLIAAPIVTYLIRYMKVTSDTIKPKQVALPFFLTKWASYSRSMFIYNVIVTIIVVSGYDLAEPLFAPIKGSLYYIVLPLIIVSIIAGLSAWIFYTPEKEVISSEQKTFNKYLLRHWIPALLALVCASFFSFAFQENDKLNWVWVKKLSPIFDIRYHGFNGCLFFFLYPAFTCCAILAPILAFIEIYKFAPNNVESDLSKKSAKDAQSKALEQR